jgi:hypothetical protein
VKPSARIRVCGERAGGSEGAVLKGIGLILLGFAMFALSRPYVEVAAGGDVPPPPHRRAPLKHKVIQFTRRGGAVARVGIGQIIGLAGMVAGIVIVVQS